MEDQVIKIVTPVELKAVDREARTITFIGTNETQDRSGDVIESTGWDLKNFQSNPVFLWSHDGRAFPPIGRAVQVQRTGNSLKFKIEFVPPEIFPFADTIFKLYAAGFLRGVSVGFLPKKREMIVDDKTGNFVGFRFVEQELIELSAVSVPDNPDALILEAQDGALQKEASEFLAKSLYAENTLLKTINDLKGLILQADTKGEDMDSNNDGKSVDEGKDLQNIDDSIDKRLEKVENTLEQVISHQEMQKAATELFGSVKSLLEEMKSKSEKESAPNKFVDVLVPGTEPQGMPQGTKELVDAISKITDRWKNKKWTPAEPKQ